MDDNTPSVGIPMIEIKYIDGHFEMEEDGYMQPEPIIHLFGRGADMMQHHVRVNGYYPHFCALMTETLDKHEALDNDHRIRKIETVEDDGEAIVGNNGERLAKIYTISPYDVSDVAESFSTHWEADVNFLDQFCYDVGLVDGFAVPDRVRETSDPIKLSDITTDGVDVSVTPRVCYFDIEVQQTEEGPSVVSKEGKELADNPVTAISAYDSYTMDYSVYVLEHEAWDTDVKETVQNVDGGVQADVQLFDTERELLSAFASYMERNRFDVLTAWNIGFDAPYLVNRYFTLDHMDVFKLTPMEMGGVNTMNGSGSWINGDIKGVELFDMLAGFEKASIHELDDSRLETVAQNVTDIEKLDVDEIDDAWEHDPEQFVKYSIRDTEAVVAIDNARGILT